MATAERRSRDTVCRALATLEVLAREGGELGVGQVAKLVGLNKATVYRLLQSMVAMDFVIPGSQSGTYRAGAKLCELGNLVLERIEFRQEVSVHLRRLVQESGETVHLVMMDDGHGLYVDKFESPQVIRMYSRVGRRIPLYCTAVGKVLLAAVPPEQRMAAAQRALDAYDHRRFTVNTIVDLAELERELEVVGSQGFAIDREEHEPGVICVAAGILNHQGVTIASCSLSAPLYRVSADRLEAFKSMVVKAAAESSRSLGYSPASAPIR